MDLDDDSSVASRPTALAAESAANRYLSLTPVVLLATQHEFMSISEFVELLQQQGFGGKRGCRKLVHRLERLGLLAIGPGIRGDRREKSISPTLLAREQLRTVVELIDRVIP